MTNMINNNYILITRIIAIFCALSKFSVFVLRLFHLEEIP